MHFIILIKYLNIVYILLNSPLTLLFDAFTSNKFMSIAIKPQNLEIILLYKSTNFLIFPSLLSKQKDDNLLAIAGISAKIKRKYKKEKRILPLQEWSHGYFDFQGGYSKYAVEHQLIY